MSDVYKPDEDERAIGAGIEANDQAKAGGILISAAFKAKMASSVTDDEEVERDPPDAEEPQEDPDEERQGAIIQPE